MNPLREALLKDNGLLDPGWTGFPDTPSTIRSVFTDSVSQMRVGMICEPAESRTLSLKACPARTQTATNGMQRLCKSPSSFTGAYKFFAESPFNVPSWIQRKAPRGCPHFLTCGREHR